MNLPPWTPCPHCDEFWCNIHDRHAFECDCPPIEEWETDPYTAKEEGPTTMPTATRPRPTLRSQAIAELLAIRDSAAAELATMPSAKQASEWAVDRYQDVQWCNRALSRLGVDVSE
jgi:hypothetical protein